MKFPIILVPNYLCTITSDLHCRAVCVELPVNENYWTKKLILDLTTTPNQFFCLKNYYRIFLSAYVLICHYQFKDVQKKTTIDTTGFAKLVATLLSIAATIAAVGILLQLLSCYCGYWRSLRLGCGVVSALAGDHRFWRPFCCWRTCVQCSAVAYVPACWRAGDSVRRPCSVS